MIKCCIFDLDGTLLNTLTTIHYYVSRALMRSGLDPITEEQCRIFIGHGARNLLRRSFAEKGVELSEERLSEILGEFNREYNANTLYLTEPYSGIPEMIDELRRRGVILGVLSNKPNETTNIIIREIFGGKFDLIRGGREGIPLKPSPMGLTDMIAELGLSPSEVVYIGDTGVDIETGKAAGVYKTVGVSWGFRSRDEITEAGATAVVDHPLDIILEVFPLG